MSSSQQAPPNPKVIDIISKKREDGKPYVSLEYFPPRTEEGVKNLYARMDRMKNTLHPAFSDVTWGAGGSTAELSLDLALYMQRTGHVSNMHLTCTNLEGKHADPKQAVLQALKEAYDGGIRNIVALRGDPPAGQEEWKATEGGFACALDLVRFIKDQKDMDFGISVAGYPEGHPSAITEIDNPSTLTAAEKARSSSFDGKTYCCLDADYKKELDYLKEKVDAGGDFIITQMFFDVGVFLTFVKDCRAMGITCPIVPGLMCLNNANGFEKMTRFCKTCVPASLTEAMSKVDKTDRAAFQQFGIEFGTQLCKELLDSGEVSVLHFYTLNLEKVVYGILDRLGWSDDAASKTNEADANSQVAVGSAWARVGDKVKTEHGDGVVVELDASTGKAKIRVENPTGDGQPSVVLLEKGKYEKIF